MGLLDQGAAAAAGGGAQPVPPAPTAPDLAQSAAAAGAPPPGAAMQPPAGAPPMPPGAGAPPPAGPAAGGAPPMSPGGGVAGNPMPPAAGGGGAMQPVDIGEEQATPEEQQEYERAMKAVAAVLYENEKASNSIVDQVNPNDKVSTTSKVAMLFINQLDQKIDLDEVVVADVTQEATARIMELAENRHGMQYDEREAQIIIGSVWEGVSEMFGGGQDEAGHSELVNSIGPDKLGPLKENYEAALNG